MTRRLLPVLVLLIPAYAYAGEPTAVQIITPLAGFLVSAVQAIQNARPANDQFSAGPTNFCIGFHTIPDINTDIGSTPGALGLAVPRSIPPIGSELYMAFGLTPEQAAFAQAVGAVSISDTVVRDLQNPATGTTVTGVMFPLTGAVMPVTPAATATGAVCEPQATAVTYSYSGWLLGKIFAIKTQALFTKSMCAYMVNMAQGPGPGTATCDGFSN